MKFEKKKKNSQKTNISNVDLDPKEDYDSTGRVKHGVLKLKVCVTIPELNRRSSPKPGPEVHEGQELSLSLALTWGIKKVTE